MTVTGDGSIKDLLETDLSVYHGVSRWPRLRETMMITMTFSLVKSRGYQRAERGSELHLMGTSVFRLAAYLLFQVQPGASCVSTALQLSETHNFSLCPGTAYSKSLQCGKIPRVVLRTMKFEKYCILLLLDCILSFLYRKGYLSI